jgi:hypothetical protein
MLVPITYAVVDEDTVVIRFGDAEATCTAMLGSSWLQWGQYNQPPLWSESLTLRSLQV